MVIVAVDCVAYALSNMKIEQLPMVLPKFAGLAIQVISNLDL